MRLRATIAALTVLLAGGAAADGEPAGEFDYYVLALSWSPNWCKLEGRAKELGFTLRETRELLELRAGSTTCGTVRARATEKLDDVRRKIEDLQRIEQALVALAEACPGDGRADDCPILLALERGFGDER